MLLEDTKIQSISLSSLTFAYGAKALFKQADYQFNAGEITQIKGANGCGKTTLLKILAGLIHPEQMTLTTELTTAQYRQSFIHIGHQSALKPQLTPRQNLRYDSVLYEKSLKINVLESELAKWSLQKHSDTPVNTLSFGQQRKVALSRLSLFPRQVWLLDEPFQGLDRESCEILAQMMQRHVQNQGIVVLSNHQTQGTPSLTGQVTIAL